MFKRRNRNFLVLFLILCLLLSTFPVGKASANGNPVITPGANPNAVIDNEAMFLSFSNGAGPEVLLGKAGLAEGERTQVDFSGGVTCDGTLASGTWMPTNHVILDYIYATGSLVLDVLASNHYCLTFAVGKLSPLNYLELGVINEAQGGTVSFNNVRLNGVLLNFDWAKSNYQNMTALDYSLGFRLEGDLVLTGTQPDGITNFVSFKVGYLPEDKVGPITTEVMVDPNPVILNGKATVSAKVDDQTTGGSKIASAEYSLDGGISWQAMAALDGVFDQPVEVVTAEFTATSVLLDQVCVRGTDVKGNIGEMVCASFAVVYQFEGFFRPVQMNVINSAKAGRTIPIKWRLTDALGALVTDRASFEGLYSYPVDCKTWIGEASQAVKEFATNGKGLQLTEDGNWQFNWKTPQEYAGTCRIMYVDLAGGANSPELQLIFR